MKTFKEWLNEASDFGSAFRAFGSGIGGALATAGRTGIDTARMAKSGTEEDAPAWTLAKELVGELQKASYRLKQQYIQELRDEITKRRWDVSSQLGTAGPMGRTGNIPRFLPKEPAGILRSTGKGIAAAAEKLAQEAPRPFQKAWAVKWHGGRIGTQADEDAKVRAVFPGKLKEFLFVMTEIDTDSREQIISWLLKTVFPELLSKN